MAWLIAGPFLLVISVICDCFHFLRRLYNPSAYQLHGPQDLLDLAQIADQELSDFDLNAFKCLYQAVATLVAKGEKVKSKQVVKETAKLLKIQANIFKMVY